WPAASPSSSSTATTPSRCPAGGAGCSTGSSSIGTPTTASRSVRRPVRAGPSRRWCSTGRPTRAGASCRCTWTSTPPTASRTPSSSGCSSSARAGPTSARAASSPGTCSPTRRATSSACCADASRRS
ncbi:MAG: hypothetical protein AVDCRST_MAG16-2881, partial [uncultured Frankineae bacterium]